MPQDISPAIHLLLQKHEHLLRSLLKYASPMKMPQKLWATSHIVLPIHGQLNGSLRNMEIYLADQRRISFLG